MTAIASTIALDPAAVHGSNARSAARSFARSTPGTTSGAGSGTGRSSRHPAVIARCAGGADVRAAVTFARRTGLPVAVRGGGHSFPGLSVCDGGVVIDLGPMKGIRVDPEARTRVQAGALLGELDRATQAFGLAVPAGS